MPDRLREFQRNASFVGFIFIACFACSVYLVEKLRDVMIPLVWAAFFALPTCALISRIDEGLVLAVDWCRRRLPWHQAMDDGETLASGDMAFTTNAGSRYIYVFSGSELDTWLSAVNDPYAEFRRRWCDLDSIPTWFRPRCKYKVKVVSLVAVGPDGVGIDDLGPQVNRLVENWHYYVKPLRTDAETSDRGLVALELFLDSACLVYPAVWENPALLQSNETGIRLSGVARIDRSSSISWTVSFVISFMIMVAALGLFTIFLVNGIAGLKQHIHEYQRGLVDVVDGVSKSLQRFLPKDAWAQVSAKLEEMIKDLLPNLLASFAGNLKVVLWEVLLFLIYMFFWVFEPLPIDASVSKVFQSYLLLKTVVCLLFAVLLSGLLWFLDCPLWPLFFILTFLLNYIPEVGAVFSAGLAVPAVLFDGRLDMHTRLQNTVLLMIFGTIFKVICGNVIEVRMYSTSGGQFMRMHPVVLMAVMMLCSAVLGITGMFLAIPIMATVKYYTITTGIPGSILNPLLLFVEGDEAGPHKNYIEVNTPSLLENAA